MQPLSWCCDVLGRSCPAAVEGSQQTVHPWEGQEEASPQAGMGVLWQQQPSISGNQFNIEGTLSGCALDLRACGRRII